MLIGHEVDDARTILIEFRGICVLKAEDMTGIFDNGNLHTEADTEIRHVVFSCIACGGNHSLDTASAETARHDDTVAFFQNLGRIFVSDLFGIDPTDIHLAAVFITGMTKRFGY